MTQAPPQDRTAEDERILLAPAVSWSIILLAVLAVIYCITVARIFVVPVVMAFVLAAVFSPLCRWLRRRGIPEAISAFMIVAAVVAGVGATALALAAPVSGWMDDAPAIAREFEWKLRGIAGMAEAVADANEQVQEATSPDTSDPDGPVEVVVRENGPLTTVALSAPVFVGQTVFVLILMYFVLASGTLFYERLVQVMPTFADKRRAVTIAYEVEREVSRYLLTITVINAGLGVAVAIAFYWLGMPSPWAFGIMAFLLNYVPFIGALVGTAVAFVVGIVTTDTAGAALWVAAVFWLLTAIEGQFITPMAVGRQLKLNTVVILISVAFWAWTWSIMGMLLAVPLLVTLRVFCRHIPQLAGLGAFLAGRDDPAEEADAKDQTA